MNRNLGEILGERKLHRKVGRRNVVVTVTLGKPRKRKDDDWKCPFHITGRAIQHGYGVDAIQALTTALEGIRVILEQGGQQYSWLDGDYTGFDRLVTSSFGTKFTARLNRIIDREIERFVNGLERAHKKRPRPRSSTSAT